MLGQGILGGSDSQRMGDNRVDIETTPRLRAQVTLQVQSLHQARMEQLPKQFICNPLKDGKM